MQSISDPIFARNQMLDAIKGVSKSNKNGLFINSCFAHCQSERQDTWFADDSLMIQDKLQSVALLVGGLVLRSSGS
ncbi:hypothetical protein Syun_021179 [Stephania yunnanensis]|uniref:Pectin acetylesterase n=1 Tax=Stephania yunnanensis TaxID=152371 RepID=A0AAP0NNX1_9MAGN